MNYKVKCGDSSFFRPVGEFSMGRVRQCPYKTNFLCSFVEFATLVLIFK
jgi:hypothetical protein